jgi:hypothetical protein
MLQYSITPTLHFCARASHLALLNSLESEFFNSLLDLASWLTPVQGSDAPVKAGKVL